MVHPQQKLEERRGTAVPNEEVWHSLNAEQKMAFYRLQGYGYRLLFVRRQFNEALAVVAQDHQLATIDCRGEVDMQPTIKVRA